MEFQKSLIEVLISQELRKKNCDNPQESAFNTRISKKKTSIILDLINRFRTKKNINQEIE